MTNVLAEKAHVENSAPVRTGAAPGRMQGQHVEADDVAGLQRPAHDRETFALALDVGQIGQAAFGEPFGLLVHEGARHQPRPAVRANDELERRCA